MKRIIQVILVIIIPNIIIFTLIAYWNPDYYIGAEHQKKLKVSEKEVLPADHSKFPELQKEFKTPQEVTEACIGCHTERGNEFMETEHWKWLKKDSIPGRAVIDMGKVNLSNNFCINVNSNEKLCSMCHAGYGYGDKNFDFHNPNNIDCIVCHDNTGTYKKSKPTGPNIPSSGYPALSVNLSQVAQHVGYPTRNSCGSCHYKGGGGNNVKHGDLEKVLNNCTREIDVHMNTETNMDCQECHTTKNHLIKGDLASVSSSPKNGISCTDCHTTYPHNSKTLNDHYQQVACQTCHIPTYAKDAPTKVYWDWSTSGEMKDGKQNGYTKKLSGDSTLKYDAKHGTAIFAKNLQPEYIWSNGYYDHIFSKDKIDTTLAKLNTPLGSYADNLNPADSLHPSRIFPVKIMRGKQIYDIKNLTLIQPKLVGKKGSGAYWKDFDWDASARAGMEYAGIPYSGEYGFVNTESYWPINHMVSPKEDALSCEECHAKEGRLKELTSFYLPGRDSNAIIDKGGLLMLILIILGVSIHGGIRIFSNKQ